ncbi:MAG TPA: YchJ family protein [Planctomycetota bacterium]|nr:YchJ family protein [Planctomycetota bacterium]
MASKAPEFTPPRLDQPCPCGSGQSFAACCNPILKREKPAPDAERLMRSRFTAHVARDFEHLHRTVLETAKEPYVADGDVGGTAWTRLVIHSHEKGTKPDFAYVDFTAYYQEGEVEKALHEKAEFQRVEGTWYYTRAMRQGPAPIKLTQAKAGRNDPCPCGSGKKYKQCCLNK